MKADELKEEVVKILNEAPKSRQLLLENYNNFMKVADYCCENYVQSGDDASKALEETKTLTAQSLASIAYQINTLATNVLGLLDAQTQQLRHMESSINLIGQTVEMHREKVSRKEIGIFTAVRRVPRGPKISTPATPPQPRPPYSRRPISYQQLDHVGHGVKLTGKAGERAGSIRKPGSSIRSSKPGAEGLKCSVAPSGGSSTFGKPVAPPTVPPLWQAPPESDVLTTLLDDAPPLPPDSSEMPVAPPAPLDSAMPMAPPSPPDSSEMPMAPPPPPPPPLPDSPEMPMAPPPLLDSAIAMAPPSPPDSSEMPVAPPSLPDSVMPVAPPPPPLPTSETLTTTIVLPLTPPPGLETVLEESSLPPPSPPPPDHDHAFPLPSNDEPELPDPPPTTQEVDAGGGAARPPPARSVSLRVRSGPASRRRQSRSLFLPAVQSLLIPPPPPYPPPRAPPQLSSSSSSSSHGLSLPARLEHLDLELPALPPPPPPPSDDFTAAEDLSDAPPHYLDKVVVLYRYEEAKPGDLSMAEGDVVYVTHRHDNGWYEGVLRGQRGFFPNNYVQSCGEAQAPPP
ncbi:ABI family, member 3a isoform X1 [Vanacampus margaritifer]